MRLSRFLVTWAGLLTSLVWPSPGSAQFPDAHNPPPAGWTGPVFKLRQDYPSVAPPAETYPWKQFDFKTQPLEYVQSVLQYCYQGNTDANVDWQVEKNRQRNWYHAPWMHATDSGREFIHGLTRERNTPAKDLHPNQTATVQNWAVSIYNPSGGYTIGQVWKDPNAPDSSAARFADGAVSVKLLFTEATDQAGPTQVPFLTNAKAWQADINRDALADGSNVPTLRLLQIDVAVRDARNDSNTGWVFGTFIYNGNATGATPYDRMIPVGLMWGNDPGVTPTMVMGGTVLQQSYLNPAVSSLMQHYGWAGRLNGPVDNKVSSCLSCHSTAQVPQGSNMTPASNDSESVRLKWFRNIKAGDPFDVGGQNQSVDYSLQLSAGIQRFHAAQGAVVPAVIANQPMLFTKEGQRVFAVTRGDHEKAEHMLARSVPAAPSSAPETAAERRGDVFVEKGGINWKDLLVGVLVGMALSAIAVGVMKSRTPAGKGYGPGEKKPL
jgi:hypothetical protein